METIKSYTDINQSSKLAKILYFETADQSYIKMVIAGDNINVPEEMQYAHSSVPFALYNGIGIPCWSLAALLGVLPNSQGRYTKSLYWFDDAWHCEYIDEDGEGSTGTTADNPIDACVAMIEKLHELKLL